jgi:hypothetical protein
MLLSKTTDFERLATKGLADPAALGKKGTCRAGPCPDRCRRHAETAPQISRATGITNFLENDGTLEAAQRIARHARITADCRTPPFR